MTRDIHVHAKVMVFAGLFTLFLLSLIFRTYRLNEYPVGFHNDEVYVAYNSWSLLETGKDAYGHLLPLVINQWGDFRPAGYHYLAAASFAIFGISDWATRLPGAVFGAISVLFVWLLVARIWGKSMAWISAVILAILPWHIIISRATSESVVSLAYVLIGAYCFLSAGKKRGLWRYILACILFVLGMWTYHAARYALPVFFLGSAVLTWNKDTRQLANVCMVFFVALSTVAVYLFVSGGQARTSQVSIFSFPEARLVLDESIREDGSQNVLFTRLFHNKLETYADTAIHTALRHLQSDFLVGGVFYPDRYRAGNTTLVPLWLYIFALIGFSSVLVGVISQKNKGYALLLWAGIASLIPASFTVEDIPNIQRSSMFIIPLVIVIAFGIRAFWLSLRTTKLRVIFISFCGVCFISSFGISIHEYFGHGKTHKTWYRNNGEKMLVHALYPYAKAKEAVYVTASADNDEMYYLWYLKIPPHALQHIPRGKKLAALFPTFTFIADDCVLHKKTWAPSRLYVSLGSCKAVPGSVVERTILREDGTTAFVFLRSGTTYPWAD